MPLSAWHADPVRDHVCLPAGLRECVCAATRTLTLCLRPGLRVIVLEDNDVLHLVGGGYGIYNTAMTDVEEAVPRVLQTLQYEVESIMKVRGWSGGCWGYRSVLG